MSTFNLMEVLGLKLNLDDSLNSLSEKSISILNESDVIEVEYEKINSNKMKSLIQVTPGKGNLMAVSYIAIDEQALRDDSAYVLDQGNLLYYWNEKVCSRLCRAKAMEVANSIRKQRGNKPKVIMLEEETCSTSSRKLLSLDKIAQRSVEKIDYKHMTHLKLFKIQESKFDWEICVLIFEGSKPSKNLLDSNYSFIICCPYETFIWNGKQSSKYQKCVAQLVGALTVQKSRSTTKLTLFYERNDENQETLIFKVKLCIDTQLYI